MLWPQFIPLGIYVAAGRKAEETLAALDRWLTKNTHLINSLIFGSITLGLIFNVTGLLWVGIFFFALMVLFSILTLPVEIDASTRGLRMLREAGLLKSENDAGS